MNQRLEKLRSIRKPNLNELRCSVNSYLGIMKHYKSFYIRKGVMIRHVWIFKYGYVCRCCSVFKLNASEDGLCM